MQIRHSFFKCCGARRNPSKFLSHFLDSFAPVVTSFSLLFRVLTLVYSIYRLLTFYTLSSSFKSVDLVVLVAATLIFLCLLCSPRFYFSSSLFSARLVCKPALIIIFVSAFNTQRSSALLLFCFFQIPRGRKSETELRERNKKEIIS